MTYSFIDASGEGHYEKGKNQNLLRDSDIASIVSTYEAREAKVDKYSYRASRAEIRENDYNLNIPRYVDTFEEEELIDIDEVKQNIANIETELAAGAGADGEVFGGAGTVSNEIIRYSEETFESIKHINEYGYEFWYARELQSVLEYTEWRNFQKLIEKAQTACENSDMAVEECFVEVNKTSPMPNGGVKRIDDYMLSHYAC